MLRASAAPDGSAFVRMPKDTRRDDALLSTTTLAKTLDDSNCHLIRRPGVGLSEAAASIRHGLASLEKLENNPEQFRIADLLGVIATDNITASLASLDAMSKDPCTSASEQQADSDTPAEGYAGEVLLDRLQLLHRRGRPQSQLLGSEQLGPHCPLSSQAASQGH